ncbi:hypothetical protein [Sphingomonas sp. UNC305MFCol5.2]|uniref:hypothetical protein n=1 Tax=Sphingomonas sp. UNC305MFCol5.2 TaxID=1449076 RepID=UPI0004A756C8|nr:hypothetical protein [Sphingomonas sp. UNC305MFCol5.2]
MSIGAKETGNEPSPFFDDKIPQSARYFDVFEAYCVAVLGFAHFAEAGVSGASTNYGPADLARFDCKQSPACWLWRPYITVSAISHNARSEHIEMGRLVACQPDVDAVLGLGAVSHLLQSFGQALATAFFEQCREEVELKFGADVTGWPHVWNFGRTVRNAMSHGGKIHFQNPGASPVSWKGLTYSAADNGRQILHSDLWPGDIFDLIIEMDSYL